MAGLKKGDERKLALAAVLRARTSVPNARIAQELQLGHVSRVSRCGREKPQSETLAARLLTALAE